MARPEMTEPNINPLPLKKGRIHFEKKNARKNGNIDIGTYNLIACEDKKNMRFLV